jgi:hypothetical protein
MLRFEVGSEACRGDRGDGEDGEDGGDAGEIKLLHIRPLAKVDQSYQIHLCKSCVPFGKAKRLHLWLQIPDKHFRKRSI